MAIKNVIKQIDNIDGTFVYKMIDIDDQIYWVPDDLRNSHREQIEQWVNDGGTITEETI